MIVRLTVMRRTSSTSVAGATSTAMAGAATAATVGRTAATRTMAGSGVTASSSRRGITSAAARSRISTARVGTTAGWIAATRLRVRARCRVARLRRIVRPRLGIAAVLVAGIVVGRWTIVVAALGRFVLALAASGAVEGARRPIGVADGGTIKGTRRPVRIGAVEAFIAALHGAARRVAGACPRRTIAARHAGTASRAANVGIVRRAVRIIAEASRGAATIGGVALRFPRAGVRRRITAAGRVVESTAIAVHFGVGAHVGIRLVVREFALPIGHPTIQR